MCVLVFQFILNSFLFHTNVILFYSLHYVSRWFNQLAEIIQNLFSLWIYNVIMYKNISTIPGRKIKKIRGSDELIFQFSVIPEGLT